MTHKIRMVIPESIGWPQLQRSPENGAILFPPGFLEAIADANGYRLPWHGDAAHPMLTEDLISGLMLSWYVARVEGGYPTDPVLEQLVREVEREDGLPAGVLTIRPQQRPKDIN